MLCNLKNNFKTRRGSKPGQTRLSPVQRSRDLCHETSLGAAASGLNFFAQLEPLARPL